MQVIRPDAQQTATIVQAMYAVTTAEGAFDLEPFEKECLDAIGKHLLHHDDTGAPGSNRLPDDMADVLDDEALRRETLRILSMLPVLDGELRPEKLSLVERAASQLRTDERGLELLRLAVQRKFRKVQFSIMKRSVAHYWSPTGKVRLRDYLDMLRIMIPKIPGMWELLTDRTLLTKFRALEELPPDTLGYALHRFYVDRGFPMPGEPKSLPEGWTKHEIYHIVGEYETTLQGEALAAAFSGGNTELLSMDIIMLMLLQCHAGFQVAPGPKAKGAIDADAFFRAMARGAAMDIDLLDRWDPWSAIEIPVEKFRHDHSVPPLTAAERDALSKYKALLA